ncbi:MAG: AbrB/MazE/SpoVT family DNA-binding domain-containing protein [Propionibacteriales bacterium]|nr:AbrB/MazE/SpoVT family DNA-binding domain-containing protein [Propionibacteriales bacterium]
MRLNAKGQVTIPAALRHKHGFAEGDEVDVVERDGRLQIVHRGPAATRGERAVERLRGAASTNLSTDELMELLRGE